MRGPGRGRGSRFPGHWFADQEQSRVIVQVAADMRQQLDMQRIQSAGRVVRQVLGQPLGERVEPAVLIAGLRHPVGIEEQLVAVGERQHLDARGITQGPQAEGHGGDVRVRLR